MLPAFLTTIFFSFSIIFATRSSRLLGGATANLGRMVVAIAILAAWAFSAGQGAHGPAFRWFFLSGMVGFGFGDIALFLALPRIGPRLTILLAQCLAAPFGVLFERAWLGTILSNSQLLCGVIILLGVAVAVAPQHGISVRPVTLLAGVACGVFAALGQALGAVMSRYGYHVADASAFRIDPGSAAFQRMLGGIAVTGSYFILVRIARRKHPPIHAPRIAWLWVFLNGLAGPALGVGCYQWALATTPTGIVLPIVATSPIMTMPLAYLFDRERPARRSVIGGIIAVAGTIALTLVR